jgi:hypothetical protein
MIKIYKKTILIPVTLLGGFMFLNNASGPALNSNAVTGAPFNSGSCTNCHSGGSYSATASVQLYMGTTQVTGNIVPGWTYNVRITRSAVGVPAAGGWGFQMTCVNNATNANINAWGTAPAGTANRTLSSRNYMEHTAKISNSTTQLNIPWTAPSIGAGAVVKFYLALNTVNGNSNTTGDQVVTATAQFTQAPLPVTWLYFRGKEQGTANLLEWAVANEMNNDFYTVEKSDNGIDFVELGKIKASHTGAGVTLYTLADPGPFAKTFYRIRQTDVNGISSFYNTIQIVRPVGLTVSHAINGGRLQINLRSDHEKDITASLFSLDGKRVATQNALLLIGDNTVELPQPLQTGLYILSVRDAHGEIYRAKIFF